jgi:hypothetical protein
MSDSSRFSLMPIISRHYASLVPAGRRVVSFPTLAYLFVIPLAAGVLASWAGVTIASLTPAVAGLGVLAGGFLTGFVLLTNLRIKIRDEQAYRVRLSRLIGQTAVSSLYLVIGCVAGIGSIVAFQGATLPLSQIPLALHVGAALVVALLVHIGATGMTCVRRLFGVYFDLFSADFGPELTTIPSRTEGSTA